MVLGERASDAGPWGEAGSMRSTTHTLILGAGFGGLTVATELKRLLGTDHEVVLVDRNEYFSMGLRKLWELVGHATVADGSRSPNAPPRRGGSGTVRRRTHRHSHRGGPVSLPAGPL